MPRKEHACTGLCDTTEFNKLLIKQQRVWKNSLNLKGLLKSQEVLQN